MRPNTTADFYRRFERDQASGCLIWTGSMFESGYGMFPLRGKHWRVHRLAWVLAKGPIPARLEVCHHCDNPPCGEITHLFLGTHRENMLDCVAKGRMPENRNTTKRTPEQKVALRERNRARSAARYGPGLLRVGDVTSLPQRIPASVQPGTPLAERQCVVCGQRFLVPANLAKKYLACSEACSVVCRAQARARGVEKLGHESLPTRRV